MKPHRKLAEAVTREGGSLVLFEHDGAYTIDFDGQLLMHSKRTESERQLGRLGVAERPPMKNARFLIGGLGLGFTLRSLLEGVGPSAEVEVVELIPDVVDWNRAHLDGLNGHLLADPRVETRVGDVTRVIRAAAPGTWDAILLDIDNGPVALVAGANAALYDRDGLDAVHRALRPGGRAVFWSGGPDAKFLRRLRGCGFQVKEVPVRSYPGAKRADCLLFVADRGKRDA